VVRGAPRPDRPEGLSDPLLGAVQLCDADGHVARDLQCLTCGYNLRTLYVDGVCPECGYAVAAAVQLFVESPKSWLQRMADGAELCAAGLGFAALGFAIAAPCLLFGTPSGACAMPIFGCLGGLLAVVGTIGLTARRPNALAQEDDPPVRWIARVCLVFAVGGLGVLLLLIALAGVFGAVALLGLPFPLLALLALAVLPPVLCGHIGRLMRRVNRPDVARLARGAVYAVFALELLALICVVMLLATSPGILVLSPILGLLACLTILLVMIVVLVRASRALRRRVDELAAARSNTPHEPVGPVEP
jgi:hypothetical protein